MTRLPAWDPFRCRMKTAAVLAAAALVASCAYLGVHGPSIRKDPGAHGDFTADQSCLRCHDPGSSVSGPKTNHPNLKRCLKCHHHVLTCASMIHREDGAAEELPIHADFTADLSCLKCHGPGSTVAPKTHHPNLKGCLKCHYGA